MEGGSVQILVAMLAYIAVVIGIGIYYAKRASESSDNFIIEEDARSVPGSTAMGAEASDMSGWLLMGLPGVAYFYGLSGRFLDGTGPADRNLSQLALCRQANPSFFGNRRRLDHDPGLFLQPLP
jgi:hypothetical protein